MAIDDTKKDEEKKFTFLLTGVPRDVVDELERRAQANFRSRLGEAVAILTAVCRLRIKLPGSHYVPGAAKESEAANG